jgi:AraC-like DNA-binding protein
VIVELGKNYHRRILSHSDPLLLKLHGHGIGDVGEADISDTYVILRTAGYFEHLVVITLAGEGWLHSDHKNYVLDKGSIWISPAGTSQEYGIRGDHWHILWITLSPNKLWNIIDDIGTTVRPSLLGTKFQTIFSMLYEALHKEDYYKIDEIEALCSLFLVFVNRELPVFSKSPREQELRASFQQLFSIVNRELDKEWTLSMLQKHMSQSYVEDYFVRLCKQYYGKPPMQVVKELRMKRAWELVCHTLLTMYTIAERVGYTNPYAFSTAFKKYWNIAPSEARKQKGVILT